LIDTGPVLFDELWRTTNLSFDLGILADGKHNLTIAVADEVGHTTVKSMIINVGPFFIDKTGPTEMEIGETNSIISWSGYAVTPLEFNLTINGTHEFTNTWSGEVVEYDLSALAVGVHNFTIQLFNGTNLLYNETFWVTIYPNALPIFNDFPADQTIIWGDTPQLSWNVSDSSLYKIDLYINNDITDQIEFIVSPTEYIFEYEFPVMDEALYNVTVMITDRTLASVSQTTWIEIASPSPPVISQNPVNQIISWGQANTSFIWEVHGHNESTWMIYKNGSVFTNGILTNKLIEITVDNWYNSEWYPGSYNLTLFVEDIYGNSTFSTTWIDIVISGDPYADEFIAIASIHYNNGENAVGAPDGVNAEIFSDYGSGYIILDMGRDEDIVNGVGMDVEVISSSGTYSFWVGNNIETPFTRIDTAEGNSSFDLEDMMDSARYVRIEYVSGGIVTIDAIIALNYLIIEEDNENPEIIGPEDFQIYSNITYFYFEWEVYDLTPFNYTITLNGELYGSDLWTGTNISVYHRWNETGFYNFVLTLQDIFGNSAADIVIVEVIDINNTGGGRSNLYFLFLLSLVAVPVYFFIRKRTFK
jgi:hypothetical protein